MSQTTVQHILKMIDQLPEADRESLEQRLEQRAEAEWRAETLKARKEANARGIDQETIDEAIRKLRYEA